VRLLFRRHGPSAGTACTAGGGESGAPRRRPSGRWRTAATAAGATGRCRCRSRG